MRRNHRAIVSGIAAVLMLAAAVWAIDDGSRPMTRQERARAIQSNARSLVAAIQKKDWSTAREHCEKLTELQPESPTHYYNLACCHAQLKDPNAALDALARAIELGYDEVGHMKADDDLASLRKTDRWDKLVKAAGKGVEPVTRLTNDEYIVTGKPAGGLHFRLRLSRKATKKQPHRLVIWLHPSGASGNSTVEELTDVLHENGYALVVFTKKNFRGWSQKSFNRAVRTTQSMKKFDGLDVRRPILLGFSAGGQMALSAWVHKPGYFGGLILDAAYPLDMTAYSRGKLKTLQAPRKKKQVKSCPIFVLVGDQDGGAKLWKQAQPKWKKAGVPLEVHYVKGGQHQWLFGDEQVEALGKWLAKARKIKAPTTQPAGEDSDTGEDDDGEQTEVDESDNADE